MEVQATVEGRDPHGAPLTLVGSLHVITERKRMERELIQTCLLYTSFQDGK